MKILVVDDNASLARGLKTFLHQEGNQADVALCVKEALSLLAKYRYDLIFTDLRLPDGEGLEIIRAARSAERKPLPEVILMTAFGSVESAVEAMKLGAMDYLTKPVSMEEFSFRLKKVEEFRELEKTNQRLKNSRKLLLADSGLADPLEDMIGVSPPMLAVRETIEKVAAYPTTVLVTGETGVGKELAARALHLLSDRADKPFVRVNCASIPNNLFEAELFGHEKGAFTDARDRRIGQFESADGGTLFLDEVGEIPIELQAKLLRAIQEKEITRLGSSTPVKVDLRIIAATNRKLEEMVQQQLYREDLFYRLSVVKIEIPPLRDRKSDISVLCSHLLGRIGAELGRSNLVVTQDAIAHLSSLAWPGNIRQLRNVLERAVIMSGSDLLELEDFTGTAAKVIDDANLVAVPDNQDYPGLIDALEKLEKSMIQKALARNDGVKSRAADELKIPRTQLIYRMKRLSLD